LYICSVAGKKKSVLALLRIPEIDINVQVLAEEEGGFTPLHGMGREEGEWRDKVKEGMEKGEEAWSAGTSRIRGRRRRKEARRRKGREEVGRRERV
jgi:hypothetical protein